jgi:hypothetical protein
MLTGHFARARSESSSVESRSVCAECYLPAFGGNTVSARYLLLLLIVLYVVFALFVPAMQNIFGYGIGTLLALVILWYVFLNRGPRVL